MGNEQPRPRSLRVLLTKKSLATSEGSSLLGLLEGILADGRLTDQEIANLASWLEQTASGSALPGIHFLREEIAGILADGSVTDAERRLLRNAVLRVLPVTERERAKARIADARAEDREQLAQAAWVDEPATDPQRAYISNLGGTCPDGTTKAQASAIIDRLLESAPTPRQRMVLRFWDRPDLLSAGVDGVTDWLDRWYEEDRDRKTAWELWKHESGDTGGRSPSLIDDVPLGGGQTYLQRVKASAIQRNEGPRTSSFGRNKPSGCLGMIALGCLGLLVLAASLWFLRPALFVGR